MNSWMEILPVALGYGFFRRALLGVLVVAPLLSVLGCLVVESRMAFLSDAVGHAGLAGIALGAALGFADPLWSLCGFSVFFALAVVFSRERGGLSTDTAIGILQSAAMALGVVMLSRQGGFARHSRFLVGDLLGISPRDLLRLACAAALFVPVWALVFNRSLTAGLGSAFARSRGLRPRAVAAVFAVTTALAVAVSIQWVGILVIQALVVLPAAASRPFARSVGGWTWLSAATGLVCGVVGLFASWSFSTATGATVVLALFAAFLLSLVARPRC